MAVEINKEIEGCTLTRAYINIRSMIFDNGYWRITFYVFASKSARNANKNPISSFEMLAEKGDGAVNPFKSAYDKLKSSSEYQGAQDA